MKRILTFILLPLIILSATSCGISSGTNSGRTNIGNPSSPLKFSTTDIDGNEVSSEDYKDAKVIMVNFWEPWCGPCVSEMPGLAELYEEYKDKGLVILGVFQDTDMLKEAKQVIEESGVTYPILTASEEFYGYMTNSIPTTFFADGEGNILSEQIVGARDYEDWKGIVEEYLQ